MPNPLTDLSPAALIRANRANLYELFLNLQNSAFVEFAKADGLTRWSCPMQYAWFNSILCARDATPADVEYIEESLAYFKSKNTSDICVWLEDGVNQASWEALLTPRGFQLEEGPYGMSVDLNQLNEDINLPAGAEIKIVDNEKTMLDCADAILNGYGFPPDWKEPTDNFVLGLGVNTPYRSYVAYWDGKPVATAGALFGKEVAGIYTVATIPEARGKGFGAAVTLAPLLDARQMGYRVGTLQASKMGFPVYKKMGFKEDFRVGSFFYSF